MGGKVGEGGLPTDTQGLGLGLLWGQAGVRDWEEHVHALLLRVVSAPISSPV